MARRVPVRPTAVLRYAAILPYAMRPSVVIRRNVMRQGIMGKSQIWKVIAVLFYGTQIIQRVYGKQSETVSRQRIGPGKFVNVTVTKPLSRKEQKRLGRTLATLRAEAAADVEAAKHAS